tara:strand:- start:942 stop:1568 length:627 start_codon:yes stop_codon:yes gene_type:complete
MSFSWLNYETDDYDDDVKITNNPLRKLKKRIRRKEERYKKNPSPELENEILELQKKLSIYEGKEKSSKPKPEKKNFKKQNLKKKQQKKFRKKKSVKKDNKWDDFIKKKEEELKCEREKYKKQRRQAEEMRKKKKEAKEKFNKILSKYSNINSIPMDIINWMNHTTKTGYHNLLKKYHPDKNNNICIDYIKIINECRSQSKKVSFVSCK